MMYVFLILLVIFECIADILAKQWSIKSTAAWLAAAMIAYLVANGFWLFALKNGAELAKGAIFFSVASAILAVVIGVFFFKESVGKYDTIGLVLGIFSIAFLAASE
jgi:multidrug transporter EmrE-like cation transporter